MVIARFASPFRLETSAALPAVKTVYEIRQIPLTWNLHSAFSRHLTPLVNPGRELSDRD